MVWLNFAKKFQSTIGLPMHWWIRKWFSNFHYPLDSWKKRS